jgi:hypothetical protein
LKARWLKITRRCVILKKGDKDAADFSFSLRFAIFFLLEKEIEGKGIARILKVSTSTVSRLKLWKKSLKEEQTKILERIILKKGD